MEKIKRSSDRDVYKAIDKYVLRWFGLAIIFFILLSFFYTSTYNAFFWIPMVFISYRLFDIAQAWTSQFVLGGVPTKWTPRNIYRSLVLVFIGYSEIIVSYAFIALFFRSQFQGVECWQQALYYSVRNAATMGSDYHPASIWGYIIFGTQVMFVILFLTAVVNTIITHTKSPTK